MAFGTDSLASNDSMDMLAEMREFRSCHPDVSAEEVLRMATRNGALATGWERECGRLEPGAAADLIAVRTGVSPSGSRGELGEAVLHADSRVVMTMVNGEIVYDETR